MLIDLLCRIQTGKIILGYVWKRPYNSLKNLIRQMVY